MDRVTPKTPLSRMQFAVALLLGLGHSHAEIGELLHIEVTTVRAHMRNAARRIPGDLSRELRLVAWVRGASLDVLEGRTLKYEFVRDAQAGELVDLPLEQVETWAS